MIKKIINSFVNKIKFIYCQLIKRLRLLKYRFTFGSVGYGTKVSKQLILRNKRNIFLGKNVILFPNSRIELIDQYAGKYFKPRLVIGDNSQIHQNCHITCADSIKIGNDVIIVSNVTITDIIHPYDDPIKPINQQTIITQPVYIGDQSYLYNNVVILPGTNIGKHCVIGANSLVKGKIPDYSIAVGNPAKVIKQYNFNSKVWEKV